MATTGSPNTTEVPKEDWKFGYDAKGITKTRIIVTLKEEQNTTIQYQNNIWQFHNPICVHQYDKEIETSKYFCIGCYDQKQIKNYGQLIDGKFYAPSFHDCYKAAAKCIEAEQAKLEEKHMIYCKIFAILSSSPYSFAKPRHQEFSLPIPLIRYVILNPQTSAMYDKLVKSCKWFYGRNKLILVETKKVTNMGDDITVVEAGPLEWNIENLLQPLNERNEFTGMEDDDIEMNEDDLWDDLQQPMNLQPQVIPEMQRLPTTVEVPKEDWKFENDAIKNRIIVTLKEDGECVRVYDKEPGTSAFYCVGCIINKRIKNCGQLVDDKFNAPTFHDCSKICARTLDVNEDLPLETLNQQIPHNILDEDIDIIEEDASDMEE